MTNHEHIVEKLTPILRQIMLDMGCSDYAEIAWKYAAGHILNKVYDEITYLKQLS